MLNSLYLKTHNVTGKKYLGITSYSDVEAYKGSGLYWQRHIKKWGYDVSTEILFQSEDQEEFQRVCEEVSDELDVVHSEEYLNLMRETGRPGLFPDSAIEFRGQVYKSLREAERETGVSLYKISKEVGTGWGSKDRSKIEKGRYEFRGQKFDYIQHIMDHFGLSRNYILKHLTSDSESL